MAWAASSKNGSRLFRSAEPSPQKSPLPSSAGSGSSIGATGPGWFEMKSLTFSISGVSMNAHCTRMGSPPARNSMSPLPTSCSAPLRSRMVLESTTDVTRKAIRPGKLALMLPVISLPCRLSYFMGLLRSLTLIAYFTTQINPKHSISYHSDTMCINVAKRLLGLEIARTESD